jgi:hypothetical protein
MNCRDAALWLSVIVICLVWAFSFGIAIDQWSRSVVEKVSSCCEQSAQ